MVVGEFPNCQVSKEEILSNRIQCEERLRRGEHEVVGAGSIQLLSQGTAFPPLQPQSTSQASYNCRDSSWSRQPPSLTHDRPCASLPAPYCPSSSSQCLSRSVSSHGSSTPLGRVTAVFKVLQGIASVAEGLRGSVLATSPARRHGLLEWGVVFSRLSPCSMAGPSTLEVC